MSKGRWKNHALGWPSGKRPCTKCMDNPWKDPQHYCPECDAPVDEEGLCEDCEEFAEVA